MVRHKPHLLELFPAQQLANTATKKKGLPTFAYSGVKIACNAQPMDSQAIYQSFGVDLDNGYKVFCEVADGNKFNVGDKFIWLQKGANGELNGTGKTYFVHVPAQLWSQGLPTDHAYFLISESQYATQGR